MNNLLIMYFEKELSGIIKVLQDRKLIHVVEWIGNDKNCTINLQNDLKYKQFRNEGYQEYDKDLFEKIYKDFFIFYVLQNRLNKIYLKELKFYDYLHFFNLNFQKFFRIFQSKKIDCLLFSCLPHLGIDYIIYSIAKYFNIRTIMFYQSLFANRFFYCEDIDDFGDFGSVKASFQSKNIPIKKDFRKDLFYIKNDSFMMRLKTLRSIKYQIKKFRQIKRIMGESYYKRELQRNISNNVDYDADFVYFPLHLQPELTTSILGGMFIDQALALERLSELLPENWYIYVKENPKQETEYLRGSGFFKRIKGIKNLLIVPTKTDTYYLTEKSKFVATVTGTVGWEAITGGKNSLIFGNAWYKNLPGVFSYKTGFKINDLLNYKIDHNELERKVNELIKKMPYGVIDWDYRVLVKNFDTEQNCILVANSIEKILNER